MNANQKGTTYTILTTILVVGGAVCAQPDVSELSFLPGDQSVQPAVREQEDVAIAEGDGQYLVVWEDRRAMVATSAATVDDPLAGNGIDIYAARLDADGNLIDENPIVVSNLGRNQSKPAVAWNGTNWLVVFESQKPDWYFFEELYGVRIDANGNVLDPDPIVIFEQTSNWGAYAPSVASDGNNWLVMWQHIIPSSVRQAVAAARVSSNGTVLDSNPVIIHSDSSFGPLHPVAAYGGGQYLIAWRRSANETAHFKRYLPDLTPIDTAPRNVGASASQGPDIATDGTNFMLLAGDAYRIAADGTVLDPGGIDVFPYVNLSVETVPDVAWNGQHWVFAYTTIDDVYNFNVRVKRITPGGLIVDTTPIDIAMGEADDWTVKVASHGNGNTIATWVHSDFSSGTYANKDVQSAVLAADGTVSDRSEVTQSWPRQIRTRFAETGLGYSMAVYVSEASGISRILAQRVGADGQAIDAEPIEIFAGAESLLYEPEIAWNGSIFMVTWGEGGHVLARRLAADGTPIDPVPIFVAADRGSGSLAAAGDVFVIGVFSYRAFHEPLRYVEIVRVRASDGAVLDFPPIFVSGGYSQDMAATTLDGRAFLVWMSKSRHDAPSGGARGVFVGEDARFSSVLAISDVGYGRLPDVAASGGRAMVVYVDDSSAADNDDVRGRMVFGNGTFATDEFLVSGAANEQWFPAVTWNGSEFVATWNDFRAATGIIDPLVGDVYAARITSDGTNLDPNGFPVVTGALPEYYPDVTSESGETVFACSAMQDVTNWSVHRVGVASLLVDGVRLTQTALHRGQPATFQASGLVPSETAYFLYSRTGTGAGPCVPQLGGLCLDLLDPVNVIGNASADGTGVATLTQVVPTTAPLIAIHTQAVVRRGNNGSSSTKSNTISDTIQP